MGALHLFSGDDEYLIKTRTRDCVAKLCGEDFENNDALEIIDGDADLAGAVEKALTNFLGALRTPAFLTPQKVVWLRHFNGFDALTSPPARLEKLAGDVVDFFRGELPGELDVVIDGPGLDQRKSFFKVCKALTGAEIEFFRKADPASRDFAAGRRREIQSYCRERGRNIDADAADYLAGSIGSDSGSLHTELDKLLTYVGGEVRSITLDDCRAIASRTPEAVGYLLSDALFGRKRRESLEMVSELLAQQEPELRILAFIINAYTQTARVRRSAAELGVTRAVGPNYFGGLDPALKEKFPDNGLLKMHPFRAHILCRNAFSRPEARFAADFEAILDADRALVSGGGEGRMILEQLVIALTE